MVYKATALTQNNSAMTMSHRQPHTTRVALGAHRSGEHPGVAAEAGRGGAPRGTVVLLGGRGGHVAGRGLGHLAELRQVKQGPPRGSRGANPPEISKALTVRHCLRGHKTVSQAGGEGPGIVGRSQALLKEGL